MSEGRRPSFRLSYKAKDGTRHDVGVCWPSERFSGLHDVKPEKVTGMVNGYPKMKLSEAAARCEAGDGFISLAAPKPPQSGGGQSFGGGRQSNGDHRDPDSEIPFQSRNKRGPF